MHKMAPFINFYSLSHLQTYTRTYTYSYTQTHTRTHICWFVGCVLLHINSYRLFNAKS